MKVTYVNLISFTVMLAQRLLGEQLISATVDDGSFHQLETLQDRLIRHDTSACNVFVPSGDHIHLTADVTSVVLAGILTTS